MSLRRGRLLDKWLDGGVHRDVQRGIATQVLRESGHIQETERKRGKTPAVRPIPDRVGAAAC